MSLPLPEAFDDEVDLADLEASDALLNRLAARELNLDDLDDVLTASLAVLATEVDLDPVPSQVTRRILREQELWPPAMSPVAVETRPMDPAAFSAAVHRQRAIDASQFEAAGVEPQRVDVSSRLRSLRTAPVQPTAAALAAGLVDPGRTVRVRLLPALATAGGVVLLSMGAAAALTGGESLNVVRAVQDVVHQLGSSQDATPATGETRSQRPTAASGDGTVSGSPARSGAAGFRSASGAPWSSPTSSASAGGGAGLTGLASQTPTAATSGSAVQSGSASAPSAVPIESGSAQAPPVDSGQVASPSTEVTGEPARPADPSAQPSGSVPGVDVSSATPVKSKSRGTDRPSGIGPGKSDRVGNEPKGHADNRGKGVQGKNG